VKRYEILWDPRTESDLKKIGREGARRILNAVNKKLVVDPRIGKQLKTTIPLWSFRIGVYRLIYIFSERKLIIWAIRVGHRREIYNRLDTIKSPLDSV
jgi:mRNA interferase RelE/StbE